jgi:DNA-binding MarR family transcriptional regulator
MTPRPAKSFPPPDDGSAAEDSIARVIDSWHRTRPDLAVEPIAITARLARVQAEVAPRLEAVFARFGLRGADFAVLAALARLSDQTVSQRRLASELGLSAGTVSLRVDRLTERGLTARRPDPRDGRGALVSLTEPGRELFEAAAPEHLANAQEVVAGLSDEERAQLAGLLGKLLYTLEEPERGEGAAAELGLVVDGAPVAIERRRAVGLAPLPGLLVRHVEPTGAAAAGGLRRGDLLRSANRRPLRTAHDLQLALRQATREGRALSVQVTRGAESLRVRLSPSAGRSR